MSSKENVSNALMVVAVACAIITTAAMLKRELFASPTRNTLPVEVPDWQDYASRGQVMGALDAPVKITVFSDFECPFCRKFAESTWPAVHRQYGDRVSLVFRHWPLDRHDHARGAARAAECAARQGMFEAYHDALFAQQDSIGIKGFEVYARDIGIPDQAVFATCVSSSARLSAIESGIEDALRLGGTGTPTVMVNSTLLPSPPDSVILAGLVQAVLDKQ